VAHSAVNFAIKCISKDAVAS